MTAPSFAAMAPRYMQAWNDIHIVAGYDKVFDKAAKQVLAGMDAYSEVYDDTGVIPVAVGLMHKMESDCNFNTHLHNGDIITKKTTHVPAGRPPGIWPPLNKPRSEWWHISADDAMIMQGFDKIKSWDIARLCYTLEGYNGWGYYYHGVPSAYLWSFSNQYRGGKYIADGVWSPSAMSSQIGAMTLLKWMLAVDPSLQIFPTAKIALPLTPPDQSSTPGTCAMCTALPGQPAVSVTHEAPKKATAPANALMPDDHGDGLFNPNYWTHRVIQILS